MDATQPDALPALAPGAEFDLVRRFVAHGGSRHPRVRLGPGDDCAVLASGAALALSSDLSVEDVHFRRAWLLPYEIGWRAAAAALSDLAAMAAEPVGVLASLAVAPADAGDYAVEVMRGVRAAAEAVGAALLGGDLARSPGPLVLDVTVVGEAPRPLRRDGARAGDEVWVTGTLGGAAAFVRTMQSSQQPATRRARQRFAHPCPRTREARWLADSVEVHALIDLSDGIVGDAGHIAAASGCAIVLLPHRLPVDLAAAAFGAPEAEDLALRGGEDYELCFTAPPGAVAPHAAEFAATFGNRLTCVGRVDAGAGVWLEDAGGARTAPAVGAFQHFHGTT